MDAGQALGEVLEVGAFVFFLPDAENPVVVGVFREVGFGLSKIAGDGLEFRFEGRLFLVVERKSEIGKAQGSEELWALAGGDIGPGELDGRVEARVFRPGPQDTVVEVETIHFRADDMIIDLFRRRPRARVDRGQPVLEFSRPLFLGRHRRGGIVGNPHRDARFLEFPEFLPEREKVLVAYAF